MVRRAVVGVGAALLAGLLMGAVARLMMRLVVLATGRPEEFSVGGTVMIMLVFVTLMIPGALLASLWRGRGRSLLLLGGAGLLLVTATGIAAGDIGHVGDLSTLRWVGVGVAGLGVYAAILALPVLTYRLLSRGAGSGRPSARVARAERARA
jgi:hypothetical protein